MKEVNQMKNYLKKKINELPFIDFMLLNNVFDDF